MPWSRNLLLISAKTDCRLTHPLGVLSQPLLALLHDRLRQPLRACPVQRQCKVLAVAQSEHLGPCRSNDQPKSRAVAIEAKRFQNGCKIPGDPAMLAPGNHARVQNSNLTANWNRRGSPLDNIRPKKGPKSGIRSGDSKVRMVEDVEDLAANSNRRGLTERKSARQRQVK